jgi:hypothetical protein
MQLLVIPCIMLSHALRSGRPHLILVQSPPAVPTLLICAFVRVAFACRLVVDYHNIAYTLMRATSQHTRTGTPQLRSSDGFAVRDANSAA